MQFLSSLTDNILAVCVVAGAIILGLVIGIVLGKGSRQRIAVVTAFVLLIVLGVLFYLVVVVNNRHDVFPVFAGACLILPVATYWSIMSLGRKKHAGQRGEKGNGAKKAADASRKSSEKEAKGTHGQNAGKAATGASGHSVKETSIAQSKDSGKAAKSAEKSTEKEAAVALGQEPKKAREAAGGTRETEALAAHGQEAVKAVKDAAGVTRDAADVTKEAAERSEAAVDEAEREGLSSLEGAQGPKSPDQANPANDVPGPDGLPNMSDKESPLPYPDPSALVEGSDVPGRHTRPEEHPRRKRGSHAKHVEPPFKFGLHIKSAQKSPDIGTSLGQGTAPATVPLPGSEAFPVPDPAPETTPAPASGHGPMVDPAATLGQEPVAAPAAEPGLLELPVALPSRASDPLHFGLSEKSAGKPAGKIVHSDAGLAEAASGASGASGVSEEGFEILSVDEYLAMTGHAVADQNASESPATFMPKPLAPMGGTGSASYQAPIAPSDEAPTSLPGWTPSQAPSPTPEPVPATMAAPSSVEPHDEFASLFAEAEMLKDQGEWFLAAQLYEGSAYLTKDVALIHKSIFAAMSAYLKANREAEVRKLALVLQDSETISPAEEIKLAAILRMLGSR
ncbi:MAG: hypothetical protein LBG81_01820 [Coriobacteriaceae bacterium]|jgi:hypothetical protein|nr:hypothetical protein [Coriobacteriaceae bacterium]